MSMHRIATPERWARALDRALSAGLEVYPVDGSEEYVVTGSSYLDPIHRTNGVTCSCARARMRDEVCMHRAIFAHSMKEHQS